MTTLSTFQIHGHRGARGLFPENSLTAFLEAVKLGVTAIEMDVVVSEDLKLVVSHEPWFNELLCMPTDGSELKLNARDAYNFYKLPYAEIKTYECGLKKDNEFPNQILVSSYKPLLSEVIETIEGYLLIQNLPSVLYNIEIKSDPSGDEFFHPAPEAYVSLVYKILENLGVIKKVLIQSFDYRIIQAFKKINPSVKLGLLIEGALNLHNNLNRLGFLPDFLNPDYHLLTPEIIQSLHLKEIKVIPWTVNETDDMKHLIKLGVDGIITDYPNKAIDLLRTWKSQTKP